MEKVQGVRRGTGIQQKARQSSFEHRRNQMVFTTSRMSVWFLQLTIYALP